MAINVLFNAALSTSQQINALLLENNIAEAFAVIGELVREAEQKSQQYQDIVYDLDKRSQGKSLQIQDAAKKEERLLDELNTNKAKVSGAKNSLTEQEKQLSEKVDRYNKEIESLEAKKREANKRNSAKNWKLWILFYNIHEAIEIQALANDIKRKVSYLNNELIPQLNKKKGEIHVIWERIVELDFIVNKNESAKNTIKNTIRVLKEEQSFFNRNMATCMGIRDYFMALQEGLNKMQLGEIDVQSILEWINKNCFDESIQELQKIYTQQHNTIEEARASLAAEDKKYLEELYKNLA